MLQAIHYKRITRSVILIVNMLFLLALFVFFIVAQTIDFLEGGPFAIKSILVITYIILLIGIPSIFAVHVYEFINIIKGGRLSAIPILTLLMCFAILLMNFYSQSNFY